MSNTLPLLPRLTVNRSFMSAFLAAPPPCFALGLVEERRRPCAGSWLCVRIWSAAAGGRCMNTLRCGGVLAKKPGHTLAFSPGSQP